jgi:hypothetical protein
MNAGANLLATSFNVADTAADSAAASIPTVLLWVPFFNLDVLQIDFWN